MQSAFHAATVGNFDGLHRGHRELVERTVRAGKKIQGRSLVYTFDPLPSQVLSPKTCPPRLYGLEDQKREFKSLGIDEVRVLPFTKDLSTWSPQRFFAEYFGQLPELKVLCIGYDFHFGAGRSGDKDMLQRLCSGRGIELDVQSPVMVDGERVSSTRIREALERADFILAEKLLGRRYRIRGQVVSGAERGRSIGFPTANISLPSEMHGRLAVKNGVYAVRVFVPDRTAVEGIRSVGGVMNVGHNPTVTETLDLKIEVHLFDWNEPLYGQELSVEFVQYIRDEKKFSDLEALKMQIAEDGKRAREILR